MERIFSGVWKGKQQPKDDKDKKQTKDEPMRRAQVTYLCVK